MSERTTSYNPMEVKRLLSELFRIKAARMDMDYKISEREAEILRLKDNMLIQQSAEDKIKEQLAAMGADISKL